MEQTLTFSEDFHKLIQEQSIRVSKAINSSLYCSTKMQLIQALNRAVMEKAEQVGLSVYDICLNFYPVFDYQLEDGTLNCKITFKRIEPCQAEAKE